MRTIVTVLVILVGLIFTVAMKPYTAQMFQELAGEAENMPGFLKGLIGDPETLLALVDDNEAYLISQWQGKNFGQFIPFLVLIVAFPIFARETDKKTIYFLLARKNRPDVFRVKYFTGLFVAVLAVVILAISGPVGMNIGGFQMGFGKTLMIMLHEVIGAFFFYTIFSFMSIFSSDQVRPIIGGIVLLLGLPFFSLTKSLAFLNPYTYILGSDIASGDGIDWIYTVILILISLSMTFINKNIFEKRDF